ncbi:hypothetical protein N7491_004043 [Penicillium cf. griseofulvum]|nr:hypothetical protein N7491_004043 [Penicillium cf. griseofulvum]
MGKDTGEATLTQLDATVNELPSATMSAINLVAVDAKRSRTSHGSDGQTLAYMAMVPIFVPLCPNFQDGMNVVANFVASFLENGLETSLHSSVPTMR